MPRIGKDKISQGSAGHGTCLLFDDLNLIQFKAQYAISWVLFEITIVKRWGDEATLYDVVVFLLGMDNVILLFFS